MDAVHVNLTNVTDSPNKFNSVSKQMREALENQGYFLVDYDEISSEMRENMFELMETLFDLPIETQKNIEKLTGARAMYPGQSPDSPLRQALGFVQAHDSDIIKKFIELMWPNGNEKFSQTMNTMGKKMRNLSIIITKMIFHSYQVNQYHGSYIDNTQNVLFSMLKYSPPMSDELSLGLHDHVDASFITILGTNQVNGLMVKPRGGKWQAVTPGKNTFVVLAGLLSKAWSNGRIHAPPHKVMFKGYKVRMIYALFVLANLEQAIDAPEELVDEEHIRLYKTFTFGEFYKYYKSRWTRPASEDSLEEYASINSTNE